jgi:hypothetical protein
MNNNAPRQRAYELNYQFDQGLANLYPTIQKYQLKANP